MAWWIFQNIVMTTALAAIVLLIGRTARLGPVARHALWVLVLVKFVTPPFVQWPWAAPDPLGLAAPASRAAERALAPDEPVASALAAGDGAAPLLTPSEIPVSIAPQNRALSAASGATASAWPWLIAIGIAGSVFLVGIEGARLLRLRARIRAGARVAVNPAVVDRVAALSSRLNLRAVPVVMVAGTSSPAVWGFGRPRLLWPAVMPEDISDACLDGLIVHELAHVKRGDHLVGWIELAAGVVWWWNPLFWYVRASLREQAELACDAWVISALPNGRRAYAESLLALSAAAFSGAASSSMAVVGARASSRRVLERRLVMIMKGRAPLRLPSVGLFCLGLVAVATLPAWATGNSQQQATQPQTQTQVQPQGQPAEAPRVVNAQGHATTVQVQPTTVHGQPMTHGQQAQAVHVQPAQPQGHGQPAQTTVTTQPMTHGQQQGQGQGQQGQQGQGRQGQQGQGQQGQQGGQAQQGQGQQGQGQAQGQQKAKPGAAPVWVSTFDGLAWKGSTVDVAFQNRLGFQLAGEGNLTEEGKKLIQTFETDRQAIQKEVDAKIEARRQEIIKELEKLQDQYARAGKLDEAIAIRDYLRAGGPTVNSFFKGYIGK